MNEEMYSREERVMSNLYLVMFKYLGALINNERKSKKQQESVQI